MKTIAQLWARELITWAAVAVIVAVAVVLTVPLPAPPSVVAPPAVPLAVQPTEPAPAPTPAPTAGEADPALPALNDPAQSRGEVVPPGPPIDPDPPVVPAIDGAVFADLNGDGIQQVPGEPGMTNTLVTLYLVNGVAPGEDALIDQYLTDELGLFYFGFLENGLYRVEVDESLLPIDTARTAPETNPSPPVEISFEERTPSVAFGYRQLCSIEGAVWHDADGDGALNEDTQQLGVNNVPVLLERQTGSAAWTAVAQQRTGELGRQGRFAFTDLEPGNYRVLLDRSGLPAGLRETTLANAYEFFCDPVLGADAPAGPPLFGFVQEPSAVHLVGFRAVQTDSGTRLEWETAVEQENLGFYLYQSFTPDGPRHRLNRRLILARGTSLGGSYQFQVPHDADHTPTWYWLEDVDWHFLHTLHGPVHSGFAF